MQTQSLTFLSQFLMMSAYTLPSLIVAVAAGVIILKRWKQHPRASWWALLGFGLLFLLSTIGPVANTLIHLALVQGGNVSQRIWMNYVYSGISTLLHTVTYVFLLLAILADRNPANSPGAPPTLPPA
jgi:threonine/homoserine/homoserine lactone efflux protein